MKTVRALLIKHREIIVYVIIGGLTTLFGFLVYLLFTRVCRWEENLSKNLSIPPAMVFAYFTNKYFVFKSRGIRGAALLREAASFFAARGFTWLLEGGCFFLFNNIIKLFDLLSFFIVAVIVTVTNYVLSKFVVFRKKILKG